MCTVTFLPLSTTDFLLTSNRDEQRSRVTLAPKKYLEDGTEMLFPKDDIAGGTWIGTSSENRLVCVLNGAFKKHHRKLPYLKSRGVLAKEILKTSTLKKHISQLKLTGVEPFTIVIVDWNTHDLKLFELVWNAQKIYFEEFPIKPKIWSSTTLYSDAIKSKRKGWFENWLQQNEFSTQTILEFHHSQIGDKEQSVLMKRSYVETVSITSIAKKGPDVTMHYEDVVHSKLSTIDF